MSGGIFDDDILICEGEEIDLDNMTPRQSVGLAILAIGSMRNHGVDVVKWLRKVASDLEDARVN